MRVLASSGCLISKRLKGCQPRRSNKKVTGPCRHPKEKTWLCDHSRQLTAQGGDGTIGNTTRSALRYAIASSKFLNPAFRSQSNSIKISPFGGRCKWPLFSAVQTLSRPVNGCRSFHRTGKGLQIFPGSRQTNTTSRRNDINALCQQTGGSLDNSLPLTRMQ